MSVDGSVVHRSEAHEMCGARYAEVEVVPITYGGGFLYVGKSAVSPEHAHKLAAEARQRHLRERAAGLAEG